MNNEKKICPRCEKSYIGYPALSRTDNKTNICSRCGNIEAVRVMLASKLPSETLAQFTDEEIMRILNIGDDLR